MTDQAWTRATTVANTLADRYGLEKWAQRNIVLGIGARPDLYALATSCTPEDKKQLGKIVSQAQEAAKSRSGANLGTALHRLTERIDRGEIFDVAEAWKPDMDAYCQTLVDNRIEVLGDWIERVVIAPQYETAGTLDRVVKVGGELMIADLKTGSNALDGAGEIAVQLAIYANATHAWLGEAEKVPRDRYGRYELPDPETNPEDYEVMADVNQDWALIIHLVPESGECTLHEVDIAAGREAVELALAVRDWRKRDDLAGPFSRWVEKGEHLTLVSNSNDDW